MLPSETPPLPRVAWILLATLALTGCFSVPAYVTPSGAQLVPGADLGSPARGRWACPGFDLVLLANGHLRELNNDYDVAKSEATTGGRVFRYQIGQLELGCFVPDDPGQPARVSTGGFVPTSTLAIGAGNLRGGVDQKTDASSTTICPPQPPVELL